MRSSGDVDQVVVIVGVETVPTSEFMQRAEDFFEIPRVTELHLMQAHRRFRRHIADIGLHILCQHG